jgi:hypothetical protein
MSAGWSSSRSTSEWCCFEGECAGEVWGKQVWGSGLDDGVLE